MRWIGLLFAVLFVSCAHGLIRPPGLVRMRFFDEREFLDGKRRVLPLEVLPLQRHVRANLEARLVIVNPEEDDYCREVCCDWGDDSLSCRHEKSCEPQEEMAGSTSRRLVFSSSHRYRLPGFYMVKMIVFGNKRRSFASDKIMVGVPQGGR